jgi:pimeloyl-ACP methyl ester carboxylesterase
MRPDNRTFFDPDFYNIIIFDQRGSGRSIPNASNDLQESLVENMTPRFVEDIDYGFPTWHLPMHKVDYLFSNGGTFGQSPVAWESYCQ